TFLFDRTGGTTAIVTRAIPIITRLSGFDGSVPTRRPSLRNHKPSVPDEPHAHGHHGDEDEYCAMRRAWRNACHNGSITISCRRSPSRSLRVARKEGRLLRNGTRRGKERTQLVSLG